MGLNMAGKKRGPKEKYGVKLVNHTIRLVPDHWAKAWRVGKGTKSEGIRHMIDAYEEKTEEKGK